MKLQTNIHTEDKPISVNYSEYTIQTTVHDAYLKGEKTFAYGISIYELLGKGNNPGEYRVKFYGINSISKFDILGTYIVWITP